MRGGGDLGELDRHGIEAHCWFFHDFGGRAIFSGFEDRLHLGEPAACVAFAAAGEFDLAVTIDSEEVLAPLEGEGALARWVLECHSAYPGNIDYLRDLDRSRLRGILVPSAMQARRVADRLRIDVPIEVVPNPLAHAFLSAPVSFTGAPSPPILLWVGRLDSHKNWEEYVDLAAAVAARFPRLEAWIVGHPAEADAGRRLLAQASANGLLAHLRWFRGVPHRVMPRFFDAVRETGGLAITTSRGESFGMTVIEAMARACPVLAPAEAPYDEYIENGVSGTLYPAGRGGAAASGVAELLENVALRSRLGAAARAVALARFSPSATIDRLVESLTRLSRQ